MILLRLPDGHYINPASIQEWWVSRTIGAGWLIKADDYVVKTALLSDAVAQAELADLLRALNATVVYA